MFQSRTLMVGLGGLMVALSLLLWVSPKLRSTPANAFDPAEDICIVAPALPWDASSGLAFDAPRTIPAHARCPVCGMYPARLPQWAGQVIFRDGATHFFDSPVNLMLFLRDPQRFSRYRSEDVIARYVTDATASRWIPAEHAFYVAGSDALGPMRDGNLPAFASQTDAQRFAHTRGGRVLRMTSLDDALIDTLASHRHATP